MLRVLAAFEREELEYVLIDAAAMGMHGLVRATEDLDFFIRATHDNVERLKRAFRAAYGDDPNIEEIRAVDLLGDYPAVRYYPPTGDLYFDVMTRLGEAADFESVARETKRIEGIRVFVATPEALYRLKSETVRPIDRQDAESPRRAFDLPENGTMPLQKFRSGEEMNSAVVLARPGDGFERFARHCARYWKLAPRVYPRGVFRFRSLEEAQEARRRISEDNAARIRAGG